VSHAGEEYRKTNFFGTALRYLQDATSSYHIKGTSEGWKTLENLTSFLNYLDELELRVTSRAFSVSQLRGLKAELEKSSAARLSSQQANLLSEWMTTLRPTLEAEARGIIAYIISERRFRADYLMNNPGRFFGNSTYDSLPDIAKNDFSEAAKCLAFERPTAAAFHMLRATEATLKYYYCAKVRRKRSSLMWAAMVQSMRSMPRRFPKALLNQLDHIRDSFRNPTAHPEKIFSLDEAQDLLSICIDAANRMVQDL
jgi:hypothetical protein